MSFKHRGLTLLAQDRQCDPTEPALAYVLEQNLDDLPDLIVDGLRDAYASRFGKLLEAGGHVDADAVKIVAFGDEADALLP